MEMMKVMFLFSLKKDGYVSMCIANACVLVCVWRYLYVEIDLCRNRDMSVYVCVCVEKERGKKRNNKQIKGVQNIKRDTQKSLSFVVKEETLN